jgi:hypothetical protein
MTLSQARIGELEFLRKLQRLLAEGDFAATYKFALLNALADLSVEGETAADGSLRVSIEAIAEKFVEYYWPQARPYGAVDGQAAVLRQNTRGQALVVSTLIERQRIEPTLSAARAGRRWRGLLRRVAGTIRGMPLWKLQRVGNDIDEFLYRKAEFAGGSIRLLPGVPLAFRTLHGLVLDAVRGAWIRRIGRIAANRPLLGDADLGAFLFGSERGRLAGFVPVLRDHQRSRCLYCARDVRGEGVVDHFIAWSRYLVDLGHNLVLAHAACNAAKRDFLSAPRHVETWVRTCIEGAPELAARFDALMLPHDAERTRAIAWWAYEHGEASGAHAWIEKNRFVRLGREWRGTFEVGRELNVAEGPGPGYAAGRGLDGIADFETPSGEQR